MGVKVRERKGVSISDGRFTHHLVSYIAGYSDNRRTVERRRCCLFAGNPSPMSRSNEDTTPFRSPSITTGT